MKFGSSRDLFEEGSLEEVRLKVRDGDETIICRVSREALEGLAGKRAFGPGELVGMAYDHFGLLTDKWAHRIELGTCERDGSVLLRRGDVALGRDPSDARRPFLATE